MCQERDVRNIMGKEEELISWFARKEEEPGGNMCE